ncbi:MAG: transcriptional regulator NrdR [Victivallaceae bacterium]
MRCPFCSHKDLRVLDSRNAPETNAIKRRRECLKCNYRFTTFETPELHLQVLKKDGRYEAFEERKLINGLNAAAYHTKVSQEQVRKIVSYVKIDIMGQQIKEISTKEIGEIVMKYLKPIDMIAYIRFACVYRRFTDMGELRELMENLSDDASLSIENVEKQ